MANRADIEGELIDSLGPKLVYVGLNGVTRDGTNTSLNGPIRKALMAQAPDLLAAPPVIEQIEVLGAKLP